jgi:hypothetical protein
MNVKDFRQAKAGSSKTAKQISPRRRRGPADDFTRGNEHCPELSGGERPPLHMP